ncbi:MAG: DUF1015 family protein [Dactylosporangium sp.]|nr:DUF1015 family protein [Dactylosporangium sp.]NNJ62443.1 DUF1015 family protein [Dactylosporangium sp.]
MSIAHSIAHAWVSTGGEVGDATGAQNYDEFADEAEITSIIAANPASALAIEMPHLAAECLGRPFTHCLPEAVARLADAKTTGRLAPADDIVAVYRITGRESVSYGLWCMIDTSEISTSVDEPGYVIRNEDVFPDKVRERVGLARATGHLLSPVLLLQTGNGDELHEALTSAVDAAGTATICDRDQTGRVHEIWLLRAGPTSARLLELAGTGELVVADGNHRSLAAQTAGLPRFLAVVTTPGSVRIEPYNRLISELPGPMNEILASLSEAGAIVRRLPGRPLAPAERGTVHLYTRHGAVAVTLPSNERVDFVENLDHAVVERLLLHEALGLDPGDKRVGYIGGDYPSAWLCNEVDAGRAELAMLVAPVTVEDFVAVNLARRKMPRKSTWFTPKARAGLVIADLTAEA